MSEKVVALYRELRIQTIFVRKVYQSHFVPKSLCTKVLSLYANELDMVVETFKPTNLLFLRRFFNQSFGLYGKTLSFLGEFLKQQTKKIFWFFEFLKQQTKKIYNTCHFPSRNGSPWENCVNWWWQWGCSASSRGDNAEQTSILLLEILGEE